MGIPNPGASAGAEAPAENPTTPKSPKTPTTWTIMVYIAADDVLASFAVDSLKQLNRSVSAQAPAKDESSLTVAANFALPMGTTKSGSPNAKASKEDNPRLYFFKEPKKSSGGKPSARNKFLRLPEPEKIADKSETLAEAGTPAEPEMSDKEALKKFLNRVYEDEKDNPSAHYALILWGHGPELLFQPPPVNAGGDRTSLYLTPKDLREALTYWKEDLKGTSLDIIGFDACFMSMFEMACELEELADYMVASQDEVPDSSFNYEDLVELFRQLGSEPASLLREGVQGYVETYQDYTFSNSTRINPVTLSVLQLKKCKPLQNAVLLLSCELLKAKDDPELQCLFIQARKESKDYAGGLYVDLHEFCEKLSGQLGAFGKRKQDDKQKPWIAGIQKACGGVLSKLNFPAEGDSPGDSLILVNGSVNIPEKGKPFIQVNGKKDPTTATEPGSTRNHGISIYLPYLTDEQFAQVRRPLVKGGHGTGGAKGFSEVLDGAATEYLMCERRDLILDTESYYERLKMAKTTRWYHVITELWTRALINKVPAELDEHYSAQQSWINLTRKPSNTAKPCPDEASASPKTTTRRMR